MIWALMIVGGAIGSAALFVMAAYLAVKCESAEIHRDMDNVFWGKDVL